MKEASQEVLANNPVRFEGSPDEVAETIGSLLPPPQTVLKAEYFSQPVFPVALIKDIANFYGYLKIDSRILNELSEERKTDSVLMANVWLAHAYEPTLERILMIIDMFETTRIFNPLTLAMLFDPSPVQNKPENGRDRPRSLDLGIPLKPEMDLNRLYLEEKTQMMWDLTKLDSIRFQMATLVVLESLPKRPLLLNNTFVAQRIMMTSTSHYRTLFVTTMSVQYILSLRSNRSHYFSLIFSGAPLVTISLSTVVERCRISSSSTS